MSQATTHSLEQAARRVFDDELTPAKAERLLADVSLCFTSHFIYLSADPSEQEDFQILLRNFRRFCIESGEVVELLNVEL